MRPHPTSGPLETRWSRIDDRDYDYLIRRYWRPIRRFLAGRLGSPQDAEDLTQDLFVEFLRRGILERASRERGSFRSFLFHVARQFLVDRYRQRARRRSRETSGARLDLEPDRHGLTAEAEFDRAWFQSLLNRARRETKRELEERGQAHAYRAFRRFHLVEGGSARPTREQLAADLGRTMNQLRNDLRVAKERFLAAVREEVARTATSEDEFRAELESLGRFLSVSEEADA